MVLELFQPQLAAAECNWQWTTGNIHACVSESSVLSIISTCDRSALLHQSLNMPYEPQLRRDYISRGGKRMHTARTYARLC